MNPSRYNLIKFKNFPSGAIVLVILGVFLFSGCYIDFSKYGEYQRSQEVVQMFQNDNPPPDYQYYYYFAGSFSQPDALIGLDPAYTLDNNLWTMTNSAQLRQLLDNMRSLVEYQTSFFGSHIKDPKGKIIGIYYSRWNGGAIVMETDNKVNVNLPNKHEEEQRPNSK